MSLIHVHVCTPVSSNHIAGDLTNTHMYVHVYILVLYVTSLSSYVFFTRRSLPQACSMAIWHFFQTSSNLSGERHIVG